MDQAAAAYDQYIKDTEEAGISDRDEQSVAYRRAAIWMMLIFRSVTKFSSFMSFLFYIYYYSIMVFLKLNKSFV